MPILSQPVTASVTSVPLFFVANHGQAPDPVRFTANGSGMTAFFLENEVRLQAAGHSIRMRFEGATPRPRIEGSDLLSARANFLLGAERDWRLAVPLYGAIAYRDLYPGIDMIYGGNGRQLKSQFIVAPGSDPSRIRVRYAGTAKPYVERGALVVPVDQGELREEEPVAYQEINGHRALVKSQFVVNSDGSVGFHLGEHAPDRPLIIDPILSYSTLLGGSGADSALAIAVDSTGAAYIAGYTDSYAFPTANPVQNFNAGGNDVFVAKVAPTGNTLIYSTFIGGRSDDRAYGIAVDSIGAAYVTGLTTSADFPVRNPAQPKLAGGKDAFVFKLSPSGSGLLYSTFFGGLGSDTGNGIAIDSSGSAYIMGDTTSLTLPANGFQRLNRGSQDAFVLKLSPAGSIAYCTYLGGSADDHGAAIAVDSAGNAYIAGSTFSSDFPVANPFQASNAGNQDAFVAKISATGSALSYSTYLGGNASGLGYEEGAHGIAVDSQGNAYVAGSTASMNFPVLHPIQASLKGWTDGFAARFNAAGSLTYSTYLGGFGPDVANAIAVDAAGKVYVAGTTYSTDFPVAAAIQGRNAGDYDAFLAVLNATGDSLVLSDYLGGAGADAATALALDPAANIYVAGWTLSNNFPVKNAYQVVNGGGYGAFVTKVLMNLLPVAVSVSPSSGSGSSQAFTLIYSDPNGYQSLGAVEVVVNSQLTAAASCYIYVVPAGGLVYLATDAGGWLGPIGLGTTATMQNSQCRVSGSGSSVSGSGNNLTVALTLTFQPGFAGPKNIYMEAIDSAAGISGWQAKGTWTVSGGSPAPISVTPSSGIGSTQTFTFVFSHPSGYQALAAVETVVNSQLTAADSCFVYVVPSSALAYLAADDGSWLCPIPLGTSAMQQNSQCRVNAFGSSLSGSGNNLTLMLSISFQPGFSGTKNTYMEANDGIAGASGWRQMGTWTTAALGPPAVVSATPSSGSGSSQTFVFAFSAPGGYQSLASLEIVIGAQLTAAGSCYVYVVPSSSLAYLAGDVDSWFGPITLGTTASQQNSQCRINGSGSYVSGSDNHLTLVLAISFQSSFSGMKNIYMNATEASTNSGWQQKGIWLIP
jgi:hypothetical protein